METMNGMQGNVSLADFYGDINEVDTAMPPMGEMPEFATRESYTLPEPGAGMASFEEMQAITEARAQELRAEELRGKRLEGLRAVALMDVGGEEAKALIRRENYSHHLRKPQTEDELSMFGKDYLDACGVDAEPMQIAQRVIEALPDANRRALYQQRMEQARRSGRDSSRTYYALIGEIARDEWQEEYRLHQQKLAEQQAARDADRKLLEETLDKVVFSDTRWTELDPKALIMMQESGISTQTIRRARKAYRLLDPELVAGMEGGSFLNGNFERRHRAVWDALEGDKTAQALFLDAVARKAGEAAKNGDAGFLGSYMEHVNKWAAQGVEIVMDFSDIVDERWGDPESFAQEMEKRGGINLAHYLADKYRNDKQKQKEVGAAVWAMLTENPDVLKADQNPYEQGTEEWEAWNIVTAPRRQNEDRKRFLAFTEKLSSAVVEGRNAQASGWTRVTTELGNTSAFLTEFMLPGKAFKAFNIASVIGSAGGRVGAQADAAGIDPADSRVFNRGVDYGLLEAGAFMTAPKMLWGSAAALAGKVPLARAGMQKLAGSTAGTYVVSAARTTADFAAVIPMSTAGAKILYDQVNRDSQLASGMQEWTALMQEMQRPEYWGMMALNGLVFGAQAPMMRAAARHDARAAINRADRQELALAGLTKEEIKSVLALEPGKRREEARKLVDNHLENDAAGMISRGLTEARKVVNRKRAQQMRKDAAVQFALEQHGMHFEPCEEEGKVFLCIEEKSKDGAEPKVHRLKLDEVDADAVVEQVMYDRLSAHAKVYRSLLGENALIDEFRGLKGKVEIKLLPEAPTVEKAQKSAELAKNRAEARKRELMEEGKAEDEAREMALDEVHRDVDGDATLREVIQTADDLSKRIELEKARGGTETAGTVAFVVSTRDASGNISGRVLNLAINDPRMKARKVAEEVGEQTAKDWIEDGNIDGYTESYRMLHELQEQMSKHENQEVRKAASSFLSLGKGNKELSERVRKGATDADLTPAELADVRREVVESVSKLMHADLLHEASNLQSEFPAWARGLFDATSLSLAEVPRVMALANALATARKEGWLPEAAQKLLGVAPKVVKDALARKGEPTLEDYREAYMAESRRQAELDAMYGGRLRDPAEAERFEAECREGQEKVEAERREEETAAAEVSSEMVRELEEENPGMSHEEAVRETAERYADAKEEEIESAPAAQEDAAFSGGRCLSVTEERGLSIKAGMVKVEGLEVMPNFKQGADSTSGVVHPLRGDYRPDHDPIRVWRRADGRLVVISGRHRLDACRRAGATRIMAYVYEESPARNEAWARRFDVECNIRDNQATPLEVALYARGEYTEGRVPTDAEMAAAGLDRKGTLGAMGLRIGRNASDAVIDSLRNERIDDRTALWISDFCPGNEGVQRAGLQRALEGASKGEILARMEAELALRGMRGEDFMQQFDLFGNALENDGFMDFVGQYVNRRRNELAKDITYLKNVAGKRVSREMAEKYGVDVGDAEGLKKKLAEMQGLQERWKNPYTDTELMSEVRDAWKGETLEGWAKSEASEPAEKTQDEVRDSGTMEFDFSTVGENADNWSELKGRAFAGRDDGKLRVEVDDRGVRLVPGKDGNTSALIESMNKLTDTCARKDRKRVGVLSEFVEIEELVKSYPWLKDVPLSVYNDAHEMVYALATDNGIRGLPGRGYSVAINAAYKERSSAGWASTVLHEIQHIIQHVEGFARGGDLTSRKSYLRGLQTEKTNAVNDIQTATVERKNRLGAYIKRLDETIALVENMSDGEFYRRIAGETEARNTQRRANWDSEQRERVGFNETLEYKKGGRYRGENLTGKTDPIGTFITRQGRVIGVDLARSEPATHTGVRSAENGGKLSPSSVLGDREGRVDSGASAGNAGLVRPDGSLADSGGRPQDFRGSQGGVRGGNDGYVNRAPQRELDFSTIEPAEGEVTTELGRITEGEMGRYGTLIDRRMAMQGEKSHDAQVERMRAAIARRVQQMESLGDRDKFDGLKMHAEAMAVLTEFESLLPKSYGYGLEPYKLYLDFYAQLREHSDPAFASRIIPMKGWDKRMAGAMEGFAQRLVDGRLRREELSFLTEEDLAVVEEWQKAFDAEYQLQKEGMAMELADMTPKQKKAALAGLAEEVAEKIAPMEERMEIVSRVRADRLIAKFLERVALQLDHFRKDRTLGRIRREIDRLRPADGKDGKPVKGRMDAERYQKVQDLLKLLELTRSERDAFVETRYTEGNTRGERAWSEMGENELITVEVFDYEGNPKTITCTKQEFETYACFDSMSAAQAEAASRALGEYISTGRQAWENAQVAEKARIEAMAAPMMDGFASKSINDIKQLKEDIRKKIATGSRMRALLGWAMNSAQFFDSLTGNPAAAKWATEVVDRIGRANVYLENTEKNRGIFLAKAVARAAGVADVKDARKFLDDITAIQDSGIEFKAQMPDFLGRESVELRQRFLKLLGRKSHQKNFRANTFAEALRYLASARDEAGRRLVPEALAKEALAKYGKLGDASKSRLKGIEAVRSVLTAQEFARYANLTAQAETRAEAAKVKWSETEAAARMENREAGEAGQTRRMSRAEAAYHVLLAEQADYTEMMRRQGYTPEVLDKLRAFAGEDVMGLARELRTEMGARTEAVKEVYEKLYGMPFPQVDNYFRAFFDAGYETRAHTAIDGAGYAGAAGAGSIKILYTRQHHNRRVESTVNILNAFLDGMKQQDILLGYGSLATDLQRLMRYSRDADHTFENAFVDAFGLDAWNHMKQHVDNMTRMATDVEQCTVGLSKLMNRLSSSSAITVLSFRVGTFVKQQIALLNSLYGSDYVGARDWAKAYARVRFRRGEISFEEMASRPELSSRFKGWSYGADMEAMRGIHDVKVGHGATSRHTLTGMELLSYADFRMNVRSSQILYTAIVRKLKKTRPEMTEEQRDSFAMNEVRRALGFRSQPLDWRGRSILSTRGSVSRTGMFYLSGENVNELGNLARLATRGKKGDWKRFWVRWFTIGASLQAMTALFNWATDDEETWERRSAWSYVFGAATGPILAFPIAAQAAGGVAAVANGFMPRGSNLWVPGVSLIPGADLSRHVNQLRKLATKGGSWQDWTIAVNDALRALSGVMAASTVNSNSPLGASTRGVSLVFAAASNLFDFIMRTWRAADERL